VFAPLTTGGIMNAHGLEGQKALLLDLLRYSYEGFAWHGPNLMHALRSVGLEQAAWRPASQRAVWNVHEITLHVGDIMQKCSAFRAGMAREVDQNAFPLAGVTEAEWIATLEFMQRSYRTLEAGLRTMAASAVTDTSPSTAYGRRWTVRDHIQAVALHNTSHAAQIVSLRKRQGAWAELA
jgi:DinB superfamily